MPDALRRRRALWQHARALSDPRARSTGANAADANLQRRLQLLQLRALVVARSQPRYHAQPAPHRHRRERGGRVVCHRAVWLGLRLWISSLRVHRRGRAIRSHRRGAAGRRRRRRRPGAAGLAPRAALGAGRRGRWQARRHRPRRRGEPGRLGAGRRGHVAARCAAARCARLRRPRLAAVPAAHATRDGARLDGGGRGGRARLHAHLPAARPGLPRQPGRRRRMGTRRLQQWQRWDAQLRGAALRPDHAGERRPTRRAARLALRRRRRRAAL
mmetsp:Transcript_24046/g.78315  ORF Transcript_24046/g.78315 Transcript_24046/m.78315 type:complete len:272 (-) Transcript_24046:322-1137(-)